MGTKETVYFERTWHIHMWEWISDHIGERKSAYPAQEFMSSEMYEDFCSNCRCFACLYAQKVQETNDDRKCDYCPLVGISNGTHGCAGGAYELWVWYMELYEKMKNILEEMSYGVLCGRPHESPRAVVRAVENLARESAKEASKIAREIAHLPVCKGVLCR